MSAEETFKTLVGKYNLNLHDKMYFEGKTDEINSNDTHPDEMATYD